MRGGGLRIFAVTRGTDVLRKTFTVPLSHPVGCHMQFAKQQQHRVERSRMEVTMNYSYWRPERLVLADAAERQAPRTTVTWDRVVSVLTSAER
jgi:transcriptional regulator of nitric oxide reductase